MGFLLQVAIVALLGYVALASDIIAPPRNTRVGEYTVQNEAFHSIVFAYGPGCSVGLSVFTRPRETTMRKGY